VIELKKEKKKSVELFNHHFAFTASPYILGTTRNSGEGRRRKVLNNS
jgi:hypothetical protein